jgi:hypothetical protein
MAVESRRFINPSQPQTLVVATWLLYFNAFWALLAFLAREPEQLLLGVASGAAAYGIANEKKWAYGVGVAVAILGLVALVLRAGGFTGLVRGAYVIPFLFAVALVAALLHPMSRDYQRIWFH